MTFDLVLRGIIVVLGAYYVIGIAVLQIGINGPRAARLVRALGLTGARIAYAIIGLIGIGLVAFGVI